MDSPKRTEIGDLGEFGLIEQIKKGVVIHHGSVPLEVRFLVEDFILVELKAIINLESVHLAQAKNYLEAFNLQTGLLINFGAVRLQFKRIFNASKKIQIF